MGWAGADECTPHHTTTKKLIFEFKKLFKFNFFLLNNIPELNIIWYTQIYMYIVYTHFLFVLQRNDCLTEDLTLYEPVVRR